jgi:hypothetical protein
MGIHEALSCDGFDFIWLFLVDMGLMNDVTS